MNTERPGRNQKLGDFFVSSRLRGKAHPQFTTKTRRREESRRVFHQSKNPFQKRRGKFFSAGEGFRVSSDGCRPAATELVVASSQLGGERLGQLSASP